MLAYLKDNVIKKENASI